MPKKKSGTAASKTKRTKKKYCIACETEHILREFYRSYNPFHTDGYLPMCKESIKESCYDEEKDDVSVDKLKKVLRQIDRPFIAKYYQAAVNQYEDLYRGKKAPKGSRKEIIGYYFKNIQTLSQIRTLNWEQGLSYNDETVCEDVVKEVRADDEIVYNSADEEFTITAEMIDLFGEGYTSKEYKIMWNYWLSLKDDYPNITNSQKKLLLRYIRFSMKEEISSRLNNTADAEKWAKLANEALKQLNQSDLQGGISSFSEFFQKLERTQDVIRIMPKYRYRPNDALDFVIWCFINYCRRLEGKAECTYEEVYKFYDEKVAEYVSQYGDPYGIFTDDPTVDNRDKIKEFITLPPEYNRGDDV